MSDLSISPLKKCSKCGVEYPATADYFMPHKDKLYSQCHQCRREAKRQSHIRNREHNVARSKRWGDANREHLREISREYVAVHKEEKREYDREYSRVNAEKKRQTARDWYYANPDKVQAQRAKKRLAPRRKRDPQTKHNWRVINRDKTNARYRERYHNDPEFRAKELAKTHRRRSAEGHFTAADVRAQYAAQRGKCWHCGNPITETEYHIDHLIPLDRGGTNWPNNIVCSCEKCNLSKSNKLPHEWNGRLF